MSEVVNPWTHIKLTAKSGLGTGREEHPRSASLSLQSPVKHSTTTREKPNRSPQKLDSTPLNRSEFGVPVSKVADGQIPRRLFGGFV